MTEGYHLRDGNGIISFSWSISVRMFREAQILQAGLCFSCTFQISSTLPPTLHKRSVFRHIVYKIVLPYKIRFFKGKFPQNPEKRMIRPGSSLPGIHSAEAALEVHFYWCAGSVCFFAVIVFILKDLQYNLFFFSSSSTGITYVVLQHPQAHATELIDIKNHL